MRTSRTVLAAATAVLAVAAATAGCAVDRAARAAVTERQADELIQVYRQDAVGQLPASIRYSGAARSFVACPDSPGQYSISARFDLMPEVVDAGAAAVDTLRRHWHDRGFVVVNDTGGQTPQLLEEDPADGFRVGISRRTAQYLRLAVSSPCFTPAVPPATPVLSQDLATAREAYGRYADARLAELAGDVTALRTAVAGGDLAGARAAWRTAQLRWEALGAAYGSFGDYADAIDGLPQGLPRGTGDPAFTGLHRVEYGLWHGEPLARLQPVVDRLGHDVSALRDNLPQALPAPRDLPLRVHEILEDALRFHLEGLTDFGGGCGLAATAAAADATDALLDVFAPLLDQQRPGLVPAAHTQVAELRTALLATRHGAGWPAATSLDPAARRRVQAALGAALETLADVPGLLETTSS